MATYFKYLLLIFASNLFFVQSANILATMSFGSKSHSIFFNPLFHELAKRGHEVTLITPFPTGVKIPNFKEIVFDRGIGKKKYICLYF